MSDIAYIVEILDPIARTLVVIAPNSGRAHELTDDYMCFEVGEPKYKVASVRKANMILKDKN